MKISPDRLLIAMLMLCGCAHLPPFPEVHQCVFKRSKQAFYCVNNKTKARLKFGTDHLWADGLQGLPTKDPQRSYQSSENWVGAVKEIAEKRCK